MSTIIETDLKELLTQINGKLDKLSDDVNEVKVDIAILKEGQNSINKRLEDTQSSINKRLEDTQSSINKRLEDTQFSINKRIDSLDFIARTIIAGIFITVVGAVIKFLFPNLIG